MTTSATIPAARSTVRLFPYDRLFYSTISIAMALTVLVGFAPTYYSRIFGSTPLTTISGKPFTPLVYLHGALFTAWALLFVVQTSLVASRRVAVHRKLGTAGVVLAAAMVIAGTSLGIASAARGATVPGVDPLAFLAVPLFDMVLLTTFVTAAVIYRRDKESHKRLMILAYVSLLAAPAARMPGIPFGLFGFFGVALLFVVAGVLYDLFSRGKVHKVYLWGGALFVLSVPARLMISSTSAWHSFAVFLTK